MEEDIALSQAFGKDVVCSRLKGVGHSPSVDFWGIDNGQVFQYSRISQRVMKDEFGEVSTESMSPVKHVKDYIFYLDILHFPCIYVPFSLICPLSI